MAKPIPKKIATIVASIGMSMAAFSVIGANAAIDGALRGGDTIEVTAGSGLSVHKLRDELRELGYFGFSKGDHTGRIIKITAFAPDGDRYRLRIHMFTGDVIDAVRLKHLF